MTIDRDRILSDFIDAWNAGKRPEVDDYLDRVPAEEREELAQELMSFLTFAPTPSYSEATLSEIRAEPVVAQALGAAAQRSGLLPPLLGRLRKRLGLSTAQLAGALARELGLPEAHQDKTAGYLERWERGELASARVSRRVFEGMARVLGVPRAELEGAADAGGWAAAPVFRAGGAAAEEAAPYLELLADALETPGEAARDEVDDLFLGGR